MTPACAPALLSFAFAVLMIGKVPVPGLLRGWDPVLLSLDVVAALTAAIGLLAGGPVYARRPATAPR